MTCKCIIVMNTIPNMLAPHIYILPITCSTPKILLKILKSTKNRIHKLTPRGHLNLKLRSHLTLKKSSLINPGLIPPNKWCHKKLACLSTIPFAVNMRHNKSHLLGTIIPPIQLLPT